ncbi:DNA polymerase [Gordonia phage Bachita]|uniref:Uncharacterized protein n=1 Tax=Gordonia phage Bachita TaxID=1838061 RepID=A0A160DFI8_9CAUD|nr:DNA polymerase [Gordonia phage Bachita]ANA86689.1 hypothetical protein PBI_BACHITA_4 [Gordonia phage Bachita]WKW85809.1 hypothetical protein SEA_PHINKBODEN_4 [Gordonia Phage PhinkBoden]
MVICTSVHATQLGEARTSTHGEQYLEVCRCWLPAGHFQPHRAGVIEWPSEKWEKL